MRYLVAFAAVGEPSVVFVFEQVFAGFVSSDVEWLVFFVYVSCDEDEYFCVAAVFLVFSGYEFAVGVVRGFYVEGGAVV